MKTVVYGSWHLALVYAVGLCELGHTVSLVSDRETFVNYQKNKPPVFEPGVTELMEKYVKENKLSFTDNINDPKNHAEVCFFAQDVQITSSGVNMKNIESCFEEVAKSNLFKVVVLSCQTPIGTSRKWQKKYENINIVYFPEFLRFGDALKRFIEPDYVVMGGDPDAREKALNFFEKVNTQKFRVTLEEAEMSKHAANIFVATTVSFVSELTKFSEHFNVNFERIGEILRADKRVGPKAYTLPGMGFTGTVERDFRVLINLGKKIGLKLPMFEKVVAVNNEHNKFIEKELRKVFKKIKGKKIGFMGATYKPFTSNLRGSIISPLMDKLSREGAQIALYDPLVEDNRFKVSSMEEVFLGANAVVIAVAKKDFKEAQYEKLINIMKEKNIIDAANMFKLEDVKKLNANYSSIGRGKIL